MTALPRGLALHEADAATVARRPSPHGGRSRLPSLTGLRWPAAFVVLLAHTHRLFDGTAWQGAAERVGLGGRAGVSFFFLLSGFVLAWVWRPGDDTRSFYVRRVARIVPAYLLAAAGGLVLSLVFNHVTPKAIVANLVPFSLLQSWVPNENVFFGADGSGWSLSDEAFFYAVFPFVVPVLLGLDRRGLLRALVALVVLALAIPLAARVDHESGVGLWLVLIAPPVRLLEFAIGIVLCGLIRAGVRLRVPPAAAAVLALAVYLLSAHAPTWQQAVALMLLPLMLLLFSCAEADVEDRTPRVLAHPVLQRLGEWSYAVYLVHGLVAVLALEAATGPTSLPVAILLWVAVVAVTLVLSYALFRFVERPLEQRIRRAWGERAVASS